MPEPLLIVGASVRAAAESAWRAGWSVTCGDRFGDLDLKEIAATTRVGNYPAGLVEVARSAPPGPWMYTGALENHPAVLEELARLRPLWGNRAATIEPVRDPFALRETFNAVGLRFPAVLPGGNRKVPADGSWLWKPRLGSGGSGIRVWSDSKSPMEAVDRPRSFDPAKGYFQQRVQGMDCAAVYLAANGQAVLWAVTQQFIGNDWTGAKGFQYAGSIGPLRLTACVYQQFREIGRCLADRHALVGLFGVDAILQDSTVWPIEVNPRYSASAEVLERATGRSAVAMHISACRDWRLPDVCPEEEEGVWWGKAIVYARKDLHVPSELEQLARRRREQEGSRLADIPTPDEPIRAHAPVVTVLAGAGNRVDVETELRSAIREVERVLY